MLLEVGKTYNGTVKAIVEYGAFVSFIPGEKDGLLHISEISWERVNDVHDVLRVGDEIEVKLIKTDPKTGRSALSRKALLPRP